MALEKVITYTHEVLETGHVQVLRITRIMEDGKELSRSNHRHVVSPGDDITKEEEATKRLVVATQTPAVIDTYMAYVNLLKENDKTKKELATLEAAAIIAAANTQSDAILLEANTTKAEVEAFKAEVATALEVALQDSVIDDEEKAGLWDKVKAFFNPKT